jgi:LPXTG-motif cell wall-anchored protein
MPIPEPTEMPPELLPTEPTEVITEPMESSPEFVPGTQPTQAETQLSTQPENPPAGQKDNKLTAAIVVVAVAVLATGAFLLFWKRRK